jgi:HD-like signal output (HDOD) protein
MACAFAAEELGAAYGQPREAAYKAGLMHDLGRFGLMAAYAGRGEQPAVPVLYENGAAALEEERRQFGMDHAQAGACLVQAWGLPEDFRAVAGHHHDEDAAAETTAVGLVRTACLVADAMGYEGVPKSCVPACDEIADALPPRLSSALREAECGLRERLEERFRQLDGALEP